MNGQRILVSAVLSLALISPAWAGSKIDLPQSGGGNTELQGTGPAANVHLYTLIKCEDEVNNVCRVESQFEYETVGASATNQVLGGAGAAGDLIHSVVCVATAASAAVVTLKDGSGTAFNIFHTFAAAGTFTVTLNMVSTLGAWQLTTSTNTTCIGIGRFS
jgi:hypothetical protein